MVARAQSGHAALLCAVLALGVASAGCMVQDRPHSEAFYVMADAGEAQVLDHGAMAHLAYPRAVENPVGWQDPLPEYGWTGSWGAKGNQTEFNASPPSPGLAVVELNVTVRNHTASDAVGLLVVPAASAGLLRVQLGVVGDADLQDLGASPALSKEAVRAGAHEGGSYTAAFPASGQASYRLVPRAGASTPQVVLLIAAKAGATSVYRNASHPLALDAARNYTLVLDTTAGQQHRIEARDGAGVQVESLSLDAFAAAHPGEREARVLVAAPAQTLPGFEAAAAAGALGGAALVALARRR